MTKPNLIDISWCNNECGGKYIPFAFSSVLLDDGFAGLDFTKPGSPSVKILVRSVWHEAPNVDVGDAFRVLQALSEAEVFLVCPESRNGTWDGWFSHDKFVKVDYLVAFVVLGLHWLDGASEVGLVVDLSSRRISRIKLLADGTVEWTKTSIFVVDRPSHSTSRIEICHARLETVWNAVAVHTTLC